MLEERLALGLYREGSSEDAEIVVLISSVVSLVRLARYRVHLSLPTLAARSCLEGEWQVEEGDLSRVVLGDF